ncbi:MAG TPA: phosphoribosylanthranilate isomerase [Candidatus Binataceae bacterium]
MKICGVTRVEDAQAAVEAGADLIGLNFYAPSPRYLSIATARAIRDAVSGRACCVGVFVNAERDYIDDRVREVGLDMIQLQVDDDAQGALAGWPIPVIHALQLKPGESVPAADRRRADYLLLDTFHPGLHGGTGVARPLDSLVGADLSRVFIAGGLTPGNVAAAAALKPYAVDVASGVESAPGVKDHQKLRSFIANAKSSR